MAVSPRPVGEGGRFESTAYFGGTVPLESERAGVRTAPSVTRRLQLATPPARTISGRWQVPENAAPIPAIDWLGEVVQRRVWLSAALLRLDYPKPDLRFFVESVGEVTARAVHNRQRLTNTGGHVLMVGPTALLLYKAYGI